MRTPQATQSKSSRGTAIRVTKDTPKKIVWHFLRAQAAQGAAVSACVGGPGGQGSGQPSGNQPRRGGHHRGDREKGMGREAEIVRPRPDGRDLVRIAAVAAVAAA